MDAAPDGWWHLDVETAEHGTDYAYSLDGGPPLPDPRSAWQPHGVHGPSRVFDSARHTWGEDSWPGLEIRGRVTYELHLGTFTPQGTLDAAVDRLDYLVDLGVDVVELMPVAAFPGVWGWGYDGVAPYAVHDPYGGPAALQRFVEACHRRGLAVCLDVVYNHLGPSGNYLMQFGPYFCDKHHTPWGLAVNLDGDDSGPVRRYLIDNALRWFRDFHLDALRLDAVHALADDSPRHLLAELSDDVAALASTLGRPLALIAESDLNDPVMVTPTTAGGLGMTAQWADDVHHAVRTLLTGERHGYYSDFGSLQTLATVLTGVFLHDGRWSSFRDKNWGAPVDRNTTAGDRFVAYTTTHDQTGNRAVGDRLSSLLSTDRLAIAAAVILTSPFTPMLFMGEEYGATTPWQYFTDHSEPELAEAIRNGRRAEFAGHGWAADDVPDPQASATRDRSVLDWTEATRSPGTRLLAWHRSLIALRRRTHDLRDADLAAVAVDVNEQDAWFVVHRGRYRVVVNLADQARAVPLDRQGLYIDLSFSGATLRRNGIRLPADGIAIVAVDDRPRVADAVSDYLLQTSDDLQAALRADDVHDLRVSCRRIRSVLRAHASALRPDSRSRSAELADRARQIARALSGLRDHDVVGEVIDDWAAVGAWTQQQHQAIRQALYPVDAGSSRDMKQSAPLAVSTLDPQQAREAAARLADDVRAFVTRSSERDLAATARWRRRGVQPACDGLSGYRLRAARRLVSRAQDAAETHPDRDPSELWHLVRKAAKRLRYTAEVGVLVHDAEADQIASAAKRVQTVIGELQDAQLVRERLTDCLARHDVANVEAIGAARQQAVETIAARTTQIKPAINLLAALLPGLDTTTPLPTEPDQTPRGSDQPKATPPAEKSRP